MSSGAGGPPASKTGRHRANDRFKASFAPWFWASVGLASGLHFMVFAFGPPLGRVNVEKVAAKETWFVELPAEIAIPEPPPPVTRPALPVVSELPVPEAVTMEPVTFESFEFGEIEPPPAVSSEADLPGYEHFAPTMVRPELKNRAAVERALKERYPAHLQRAGVGGEVLAWFWIDEDGAVAHYEIKRSSGVEELDRAAESVIEEMEFSPAYQGPRAVRVIVALPIRFVVP